ncbi:MAG: Na+/H+ antiporter NhaA [Chitinophagaceae bacterium]|nr:MAG: Na+/H+ antiporter NhaA [Chitinophagaceae bacterium]
MELTQLFRNFFQSERGGGFVLILATVVSLALANIFIGPAWADFFHHKVGPEALQLHLSIEHWVNDGLMAIFFLLVGLEIERELYVGELSSPKQALLPIVAAAGGMLVPALIHFLFNRGTDTQSGFGIPMATDIAFALGILSLGGKRVPVSLKVFLTALAIIDDLGAISVIAIFYSKGFSLAFFGAALSIFGILFLLGKRGVNNLMLYGIGGLLLWYCMLRSGVHASIAGVLLAFAIPFHKQDSRNSSYYLQQLLHAPVAFVILPLFALVNTAILLPPDPLAAFQTPNGMGIALGLFLGKFVGILGSAWLAKKAGIVSWPSELNAQHLAAAALLGGIGFTMSIFITNLAFQDAAVITGSKIVILGVAVLSAVCGLLVLRSSPQPKNR